MKRILPGCLLVWAGTVGVMAATVPIHINEVDIVVPTDPLPTINARAFVNQSTFSVISRLPYETSNTRFVTNLASGLLDGSPGFRFLTTAGKVRRPAAWFVNEGRVLTTTYLEVRATNIFSSGSMESGAQGLIRLVGKNIDVSRNGLRTGNPPGGSFFGGQNQDPSPTYFNAAGVTDIYWAVGTNNVIGGAGTLMPLNGFSPNFTVPFSRSPSHQVLQPVGRRIFTNTVSLPKFSFSGTNFNFTPAGFEAFAYTNSFNNTASVVQVVFVKTNNTDASFSTGVRFFPSDQDQTTGAPLGPAVTMVEFHSTDFDIANNTFSTNSVYLVDYMATLTNGVLFRESIARTRRPNNYEFLRSEPFIFNANFGSSAGIQGNTPFTNALLYNPSYLSNAVPLRYAAYQGEVTAPGISNTVNVFGVATTGTASPTNFPGRVEIIADNLNLEQTRIRAESTIIIKTKCLESNYLAQLDAPFLSLSLGSKDPTLTISNVAPASVRRFRGTVCAWSGLWSNYQVDNSVTPARTNTVIFHVTFVDQQLDSQTPVQLFEFNVQGTNVTIYDQLNITKSISINAKSLDVYGGLNFPAGSSWGKTNFPMLCHFTNHGFINIPGAAKYGTDRPLPYSNIVNFGTNIAGAQFARTWNFENYGLLASRSGLFQMDAVSAFLVGAPVTLLTNILESYDFTNEVTVIDGISFTNFVIITNTFAQVITNSIGSKLIGSGDVELRARDLMASNSVVTAGAGTSGRLILSVTNSWFDGGLDAINDWSCTSGFEARRRPTNSSLFGTWLRTSIAPGRDVTHAWAAEDRGATTNGFNNNLALGKLIIDMGVGSRARFKPVAGTQALYVDYIEFVNTNTATNITAAFSIDPKITIYFANANVPISKLHGAAGGRFVWVPSFAGPLSSTNITYPSGNTYTYNVALISDRNIDSDGDGYPNNVDDTPIAIPGEPNTPAPTASFAPAGLLPVEPVRLSVSLQRDPYRAVLLWQARARSLSTIEFKTDWAAPQWQVLTNVVTGDIAERQELFDPITRGAPLRVYRLRVSPVPAR